jgi:hypothetical protein
VIFPELPRLVAEAEVQRWQRASLSRQLADTAGSRSSSGRSAPCTWLGTTSALGGMDTAAASGYTAASRVVVCLGR